MLLIIWNFSLLENFFRSGDCDCTTRNGGSPWQKASTQRGSCVEGFSFDLKRFKTLSSAFKFTPQETGGLFHTKKTLKWQCLEAMTCVMARGPIFFKCGSSVIQILSYFGEMVCQKGVQMCVSLVSLMCLTCVEIGLDRTFINNNYCKY